MISLENEDVERMVEMAAACISEYSHGGDHMLSDKMLVNRVLDILGKPAQYTTKGNWIFEDFDPEEDDD